MHCEWYVRCCVFSMFLFSLFFAEFSSRVLKASRWNPVKKKDLYRKLDTVFPNPTQITNRRFSFYYVQIHVSKKWTRWLLEEPPVRLMELSKDPQDLPQGPFVRSQKHLLLLYVVPKTVWKHYSMPQCNLSNKPFLLAGLDSSICICIYIYIYMYIYI